MKSIKTHTHTRSKSSANSFLGQKTLYEDAHVVVFPISYEETATYGRGTKNGPQAIINASHYIESYDEEIEREICHTLGIYTMPIMKGDVYVNPKMLVNTVYKKGKQLLDDEKFICTLGGEHTVSLGIMQAYLEKFQNISILHIDAHADLRERYQGTRFSHACVMRHVVNDARITQVGLRSISHEEMNVIKKKKIHSFFAKDIYDNQSWMADVVGTLNRNVYVTIDVDGFDPSIIPATGTPEPGGLTWYQMCSLLKKVALAKNVIGFDVVELSPQKNNLAPNVTCAKLCYKFLSYIFS
ncbi:MAG: agmatinase [Candidatus Omnitrophica bacterium]|nr:agmatinase [Candidatus Omnitrophota bacterium]